MILKTKQICTSLLLAVQMTCLHAQLTVYETVFDHEAAAPTFAFGADISWVSQQESWGTTYRNRSGAKDDLMNILQTEESINAVRFRVWVNPSGGWSGKQDVINLCKRASARGLKIMISFHYSDTWADSGSQTIPAAWKDHSVEALEQNVYDHTYDIISSLAKLDIHPLWVSMGNETKYGMLYDVGKTRDTDTHTASQGYQNFTRFINAAYKAIKKVDESILTIIHLPNAHDESSARSMFNNLKKYGANYDVIGLSAYPRWSHLDINTDAAITSTINTYMTTIRNLKSAFGKPVMVMETGHYATEPLDANRFLAEFMKALIKDGELGCFYWEPEAMDNGGYNLGAWSSATGQATIAMDAFKGVKHTEVAKYFTTYTMSPKEGEEYPVGTDIELKAIARTSTNITSVTKVEFYIDGKVVGSQEGHSSITYRYTPDSISPGIHAFNMVVTDNQQHTMSTDTTEFIVGPKVIFDEDTPTLLPLEAQQGVVDTDISDYTGSGYISLPANRSSKVEWDICIPQTGTYSIAVRYAPTIDGAMCRIYIDGTMKTLASMPVSSDKWTFVTRDINLEQSSHATIALQAMNAKGLPPIDYIAIFPQATGTPLPTPATTTEIQQMTISENKGDVYNIEGIRTTTPAPGIYIVGGKKILIK